MDFVQIPLNGKRGAGLFALVDAADAPLVQQYSWHLGTGGYVRTSAIGMQMHVLILGVPVGFGDHKDGNKLDNRRSNLRPASRSQNNANRCGWAKTGFKGVREQSSGRFVARIQVECRTFHLGSFDTAESAARAYDRAALEHFGEFARLNFPQEKAA